MIQVSIVYFCAEAGLPEPKFLNEGERFRLIIWRDWLTADCCLWQAKGRISNRDYCELRGTITRTALCDLEALVAKGIFL